MFGYITPVLSELKMKDYEKFRSYYCGLCFSLKNKFGNIPRLGLNYDTTFFAVLLDGLSAETSNSFITPCIKHPIQKRECIKVNKAISYATDLNLALIYYKMLDDISDDKDIKSFTLSKIITPYHKKINSPNLNETIKNNLDKLHYLEKNKTFNSLDEISHPFSHIIGEVLKECPFSINNDNKITRNKLYNFGYSFGKWIYLMDALDDLKKDMKEGVFNPISAIYNKDNLDYTILLPFVKNHLEFTLMALATNCSDILKELPLTRNIDIIDNVINLGLMDKYMNISSKL